MAPEPLIRPRWLKAIIVEYRRHVGVSPQQEFKIMQECIRGDYDSASPELKLRALQTGLSRTAGDDINKLLWLKSASTELWLRRRWTFTRTLAAMGMVGYLLGLGDRHPSNLLVDRVSGRIVHIDFGDCFEVAMRRERFPEHVPFRLTRMLVNACGASRIEGPLRMTMVEVRVGLTVACIPMIPGCRGADPLCAVCLSWCFQVMRVMRNNRDSMMAMLEAFVYDPLISWRLLNTAAKQPSPDQPKGVPQQGNPGAAERCEKTQDASDTVDELKEYQEPGEAGGASMAQSLRIHRTESQLMRAEGGPTGASMAGSVRASSITDNTASTCSVADDFATDHSMAQSEAVTRIHDKLNGNDIENYENLDVENQVRLLIAQLDGIAEGIEVEPTTTSP